MNDLLWNKYWTCQAKLYLLEESGTVFATSQVLGDGLLLQTSNEIGGNFVATWEHGFGEDLKSILKWGEAVISIIS